MPSVAEATCANAHLDSAARQEHKDHQVLRALLAPMGHKDHLAQRGHKDRAA